MKPREAIESCGNAVNIATGQKELDSQCVSRVALTTEYDSSISGTQKINPVAGETEKESQHVERRVWVYYRCQSGPLNHEYLPESKLLPQGSILGKRISTVMKVFAARSSISFQVSHSRSLQNGMLKQTPQNQIANKV